MRLGLACFDTDITAFLTRKGRAVCIKTGTRSPPASRPKGQVTEHNCKVDYILYTAVGDEAKTLLCYLMKFLLAIVLL